MIDLTATDLTTKTAVELRKIGSEAGVKGASKGKKADLLAALLPIQDAQRAVKHQEMQAKVAAEQKATAPKRSGKCTDGCGRPITKDVIGPELCAECLLYAEWENAHGDRAHESIKEIVEHAGDEQLSESDKQELSSMAGCPVCHPELDPRNVAPKSRSRAGMVIVAKGTEVHKSLTFKEAAEKLGWTVEIERETYELEGDAEGEGTRHFATATRGDESISLAWDGRAYDYHASGAVLKGKARKVRNLKEALRLI